MPLLRSLHREGVALFREPQRFLRAPAFGDVPHAAAPPDGAPRCVAHAQTVVLDPADFPIDDRAQFHTEPRSGAGKELLRRALPDLEVLLYERRPGEIVLPGPARGTGRENEQLHR